LLQFHGSFGDLNLSILSVFFFLIVIEFDGAEDFDKCFGVFVCIKSFVIFTVGCVSLFLDNSFS